MGIIAGIKNNQDHGATPEVLTAMVKHQRHRDPAGTAVFHVNQGIAVGGVNHFDKDNRKDEPQDPGEGIYAFVDGIVLENNDASFSSMLISAYWKAGLDFMNHLEGQFACAHWDEAEKRLILARDPFGHKPLHYYAKNNTLYFSSEIMARHVGAKHHPLIVWPDSFFDMLDTLVSHHDSPFTDTSAYPTYFAAQAGALVRVTGTGDNFPRDVKKQMQFILHLSKDIDEYLPR